MELLLGIKSCSIVRFDEILKEIEFHEKIY